MPFTLKTRFADAITVAPEVECHYERLLPAMQAYYDAEGSQLPDDQLLIAIDREFGRLLREEVCEPLGFFQGACAFISVILLRQHDKRAFA